MTIIVGGGAAGFFASITAKNENPKSDVVLIEKSRQLLSKVRISGGGRCNVTHACFDPARLVQYYPRGGAALRSAFSQFQPKDTIRWFEKRGVTLKQEEDGRMFPITDNSQTIIDCLTGEAKKEGVTIYTEMAVTDIQRKESGFVLEIAGHPPIECAKLLLATGGTRGSFRWLQALGHTIMAPVPSLFTFNIANFELKEKAGISMKNVDLKIANTPLQATGPLLITHWGFSGPAVLRLSAWGARLLHEMNYTAKLLINWIPQLSQEAARKTLQEARACYPGRQIANIPLFDLPSNLWKAFLARVQISPEKRMADLSNKEISLFIEKLQQDSFQIEGQTTYKEEFVTCGGVSLDEVQFKTMESKLIPGLFFAGEILDVDGITGGFNFQNAWTTGWIAGRAMANHA